MKKLISNIVNRALGKFGLKIVRNTQDNFLMVSALGRILSHDINVNSIIDIGASNGKWSMDAMEYFPEATVHAIEPLFEREAALRRLTEKKSQFSYDLCVAGTTDQDNVILNVADDLDGSTVGGRDGDKRQVKQKTIDTMVVEHNLKGPFLLKFDTHGYELPILEGAKNTLLDTNVIIMEVYNFNITDSSLVFYKMCEHMEQLGFRCYDIVDPMLRNYDKAFWQMDIFFCRKDNNIFTYNEYQ